ncbi:hypothetical protein HBI17_233550 [Parastagonospora nodorum]|nr:hypothetical protein HBI17_233550 [Parastagonospora nodorum]
MEPYEKQPKKLKRAFNVEQDRSYDIFDSKKRAWRIKERAPEGKAKEDKSWVYIVCLYFEKVDSGTYLLSNHWEVWSYEFFSQDKKLANKLLVIKCKKMQRIIQDLQLRLNKIEGSVNLRKRKWTNGRDPTNDLIMHIYSWTNIRREGEFRSIFSTYIAENDNSENDSSIAVLGADLIERYEIKKMLSEGAFGKTLCAIKVIRLVLEDEDAIRNELEVLQTLALNDKYNTYQCIYMRDYFHFRNHTCIVTDLYGKSIVAFLHDLRIVYADLKPDNILLVNDNYEMFPYNGTYRSPEHILNVDWSFSYDIWSIGCILVELWTGKCLFETEDDLVHLAMMETMAIRYLKDDKLNYAKELKGSLNGMKKLCVCTSALFLLERIFVCNPKKRITAVSLTDNGIIA